MSEGMQSLHALRRAPVRMRYLKKASSQRSPFIWTKNLNETFNLDSPELRCDTVFGSPGLANMSTPKRKLISTKENNQVFSQSEENKILGGTKETSEGDLIILKDYEEDSDHSADIQMQGAVERVNSENVAAFEKNTEKRCDAVSQFKKVAKAPSSQRKPENNGECSMFQQMLKKNCASPSVRSCQLLDQEVPIPHRLLYPCEEFNILEDIQREVKSGFKTSSRSFGKNDSHKSIRHNKDKQNSLSWAQLEEEISATTYVTHDAPETEGPHSPVHLDRVLNPRNEHILTLPQNDHLNTHNNKKKDKKEKNVNDTYLQDNGEQQESSFKDPDKHGKAPKFCQMLKKSNALIQKNKEDWICDSPNINSPEFDEDFLFVENIKPISIPRKTSLAEMLDLVENAELRDLGSTSEEHQTIPNKQKHCLTPQNVSRQLFTKETRKRRNNLNVNSEEVSKITAKKTKRASKSNTSNQIKTSVNADATSNSSSCKRQRKCSVKSGNSKKKNKRQMLPSLHEDNYEEILKPVVSRAPGKRIVKSPGMWWISENTKTTFHNDLSNCETPHRHCVSDTLKSDDIDKEAANTKNENIVKEKKNIKNESYISRRRKNPVPLKIQKSEVAHSVDTDSESTSSSIAKHNERKVKPNKKTIKKCTKQSILKKQTLHKMSEAYCLSKDDNQVLNMDMEDNRNSKTSADGPSKKRPKSQINSKKNVVSVPNFRTSLASFKNVFDSCSSPPLETRSNPPLSSSLNRICAVPGTALDFQNDHLLSESCDAEMSNDLYSQHVHDAHEQASDQENMGTRVKIMKAKPGTHLHLLLKDIMRQSSGVAPQESVQFLSNGVGEREEEFALDLTGHNPQFKSDCFSDTEKQQLLCWLQGAFRTYGTVGIGPAGANNERDIFTGVDYIKKMTLDGFEWSRGENSYVAISKDFINSKFIHGKVLLGPLIKKEQSVPALPMVFTILLGDIHVQMGKQEFPLSAGDIFYVPKGRVYSLRNMRCEPAVVSYTVIK
ncbi:centromere protein C-like isoform X2 [Erpetoichthys calabaricus]|uniref:centromere protein C-like isoform X2 n=1 Tax=Erpetoichthys calabaricus TaxID=27687 RepID=UPI00223414F4|nr:centromere protein C-like isoform X2 [Erpetoichthys calabaricus]